MAFPPYERGLERSLGRNRSATTTGHGPAITRGRGRQKAPVPAGRRSAAGNALVYGSAITAGTIAPAFGDPVVVPDGSWLMTISGFGDWDDVYLAASITDIGSDLGAWVGHRPSGGAPAGGSISYGPVPGGEIIPGAMVGGSGSGDVLVILSFTSAVVA